MPLSRRTILRSGLALAAPALLRGAEAADAVQVGVLFSQTGGLSIIEKSLSDATLMAIAEINAGGGVLGRPIKPVVEDGAFIVGSNYIYPREMAKVCKVLIEQQGASWTGDEYLELGDSEWGSMVNKIKASGCDVVLSNVVGDSVVAFYREFKNQGLSHDTLPICATVTSEIEIAAMGPQYAAGSFTSFPYFMAIDTAANHAFVDRYRRFVNSAKAVTHHALESSYFQVYLWKQAAEAAHDVAPMAVRDTLGGQEFDAPGGHVKIEPQNLHTWLTPRIAQWQADGQGKIVSAYPAPIMPLPYVAYGETPQSLFCTKNGLDTAKLKG